MSGLVWWYDVKKGAVGVFSLAPPRFFNYP